MGHLLAVLMLVSLGLLLYTYAGYPALLWLLGRLLPAPVSEPGEPDRWPDVTILLSAYNEEAVIDARIRNFLELEYPRERLEILIGVDGSADHTADRARRFEDAGVSVVTFPRRRGKAAVLNDLMRTARGEIVVLADARQRFDAGALRALLAPFGDPRVGAVSGELILSDAPDSPGVARGVGFYWRYEKIIRRNESRVDSTVGATGAIYAIRRALFAPIPDDTILDDVLIPLRIARRGYRVLFEPQARAYDRGATSPREELRRKVRTLAGNFQLFARERWLLSPFHNRLWFQTLSHKGLRLVAPLLQGTALATNLLLAAEPVYRVTLAVQLLFFVAALGGYALQNASRRSPILALPYTVCLLNWATVVAFIRFVTGQQRVTWEKGDARLATQLVYPSGYDAPPVAPGAGVGGEGRSDDQERVGGAATGAEEAAILAGAGPAASTAVRKT